MQQRAALPKDDRFVGEQEAAQILPMSVHWFRKRRGSGDGPPFHKFGSRVLYRLSDLYAFAEKHKNVTKGEEKQNG